MTRPPRAVAAVAIVCATLLGGACSSRGDSIEPSTQTLLQRDVQTLTRAVAEHDYAAARAATLTLNADLNSALAAGKISKTKMAQVNTAIAKVAATLDAQPTPFPKPTTPAGDRQTGDGEDQGD